MFIHQAANSAWNYNYNSYVYNNVAFSAHFHNNFEIAYVIEGEMTVTVNGMEQAVGKNEYAMVLPNQIHSYRTNEKSKVWIVVFSPDFIPKFAQEIEKLQGKTVSFRCEQEITDFVQYNLLRRNSTVYMKKACFYALCDRYKETTELEPRQTGNDNMIGNLLNYISEHFCEDISLHVIAAKFGYEYHYLSRLLSKKYKIRFRELLNQYRVDAAIQLLQSGGDSVTDIALKSGFQSIRTFNDEFKKITGKNPVAFYCKNENIKPHYK